MSRTSIKLNGIKRNGELYLSPVMAESKRRFIAGLANELPVEIQIKAIRFPKSKKQLGAIFGLMLKNACIQLYDLGLDTSYIFHLPKPTGVKIDEDLLKDYLYSTCPIFDSEGNRIGLSSSDTAQASKFFDDSRNWLSSQFGIYIEDPNPLYQQEKKESAK